MENKQEDKFLRQADVETSTLYIMSIAMDLIMRDCAWRMSQKNASWKHEKKQKFSRYIESVRRACQINDEITQDIYDSDKKNNYKNVDLWLKDGNELARLILLFADRSTNTGVVRNVFLGLESSNGEGIIDDELLKKFYLK